MDYIFVSNFMKIRRGQDFFVDLAWNDPIGRYIAVYKYKAKLHTVRMSVGMMGA